MLAVIIMLSAGCSMILIDLKSVVIALKNCMSMEVEIETDTEDILCKSCCRLVESV